MKKLLKNYKIFCLILCILLLICSTFAVTIGSVSLKGTDVWKIIVNKGSGKEIFHREWKSSIEIIVWNLRVLMPIVKVGFHEWSYMKNM